MAFKSNTSSDLRSILESYVIRKHEPTPTEPSEEDDTSPQRGKQHNILSGKHHGTKGRKLIVPKFLSMALERAQICLQREIADTWPASARQCITESYIVSAILYIGFDSLFKDSQLLKLLNELYDLYVRINDVSGIPEYSYEFIHTFSEMSIPNFPSYLYSSKVLIQPRVPSYITNQVYDIASGYRLDKGQDGNRIIQLCLMKVLLDQSFTREEHKNNMRLCLSEIERSLAQRVLMLQMILKTIGGFVKSWQRVERKYV